MRPAIHLINSLSIGGAERMLLKLAEESARSGVRLKVYTLLGGGALRAKLQASADVERLGPKNFWTLMRTDHPVICWMYHSCLVGGLLKAFNPKLKLIWNIRHSLHDMSKEKPMTRLVIQFLALTRFMADAVMFNSSVARDQHQFLCARPGYVVPNGFEVETYRHSEGERNLWHAQWKVGAQNVVGLVARFHPMKGHEVLLTAANKMDPPPVLVFAGEGTQTPAFANLATKHFSGVWFGLGPVENVPGLMSALDVLVVPSLWGEGFPNVIGEAMLCETLCLASDVGDARFVLGRDDVIVTSDWSAKLHWVTQLGAREKQQRKTEARERVLQKFSLPAVAQQLQDLVESTCAG